MSFVTLLHPEQETRVAAAELAQKCGLFTDNPALLNAPYGLRSSVPVSLFWGFVSALVGCSLNITRANIRGLLNLRDEFDFETLRLGILDFIFGFDICERIRSVVHFDSADSWNDFTIDCHNRAIVSGSGSGCWGAGALCPGVALQLSVDACVRRFSVGDCDCDWMPSSSGMSLFEAVFSGSTPRLNGANFESVCRFFWILGNWRVESVVGQLWGLSSNSISLLSVDALDAVLSAGSFDIDRCDLIFDALEKGGGACFCLLGHVGLGLVRPSMVSEFSFEFEVISRESVWGVLSASIWDFLFRTPPFKSLMVSEFPPLSGDFRGKSIELLWRKSRDGFTADAFHSLCDDHANTLTVITDTGGTVPEARLRFTQCFLPQ
jgi:hypothetical protein